MALAHHIKQTIILFNSLHFLEEFLWRGLAFSPPMKKNYQLRFGSKPAHIADVKGNLPHNCLYPIKAVNEALKYFFDGAVLLRQQLQFEHYHIDNFQLDTEVPFKIGYELPERRVFITFILHNDVDFSMANGSPIMCGKAFSYYMSAERKGRYYVHCKPGTTVIAVVSVLPKWIVRAVSGYPLLTEAIDRLLHSNSPFEVLPHFPIDQQVTEWLSSVRNYGHENPVARDGHLATHLAMGLGNYEKQLARTDTGRVYQMKCHLEQHYPNPNLHLGQLMAQNALSERTAMRKFKQTYGIALGAYLLNLRMCKAHELIEEKGMRTSQVAHLVGYHHANSFRKAYRKFLAQKRK